MRENRWMDWKFFNRPWKHRKLFLFKLNSGQWSFFLSDFSSLSNLKGVWRLFSWKIYFRELAKFFIDSHSSERRIFWADQYFSSSYLVEDYLSSVICQFPSQTLGKSQKDFSEPRQESNIQKDFLNHLRTQSINIEIFKISIFGRDFRTKISDYFSILLWKHKFSCKILVYFLLWTKISPTLNLTMNFFSGLFHAFSFAQWSRIQDQSLSSHL